MSLEASVHTIVEKAVPETGCELVDLKIDGRRHVRVWIDKEPEGVKIVDCALVNRAVKRAMSDAGIDEGAFQVEVLSPGVDRVLTRPKDYTRFQGQMVVVHLAKKRGDRRKFRGHLVGLVDGKVAINEEVTSQQLLFDKPEIDEVRLVPSLK